MYTFTGRYVYLEQLNTNNDRDLFELMKANEKEYRYYVSDQPLPNSYEEFLNILQDYFKYGRNYQFLVYRKYTARGLSSLSGLFLAWELEGYWPEFSSEKRTLLINLIKTKFYEGIDSNKINWVKKRLKKMDLLQLLYIYSAISDNSLKIFIKNNFNQIMPILNLINKERKCYFKLKKNLIRSILKSNLDNIAQLIIDFYEGKFI